MPVHHRLERILDEYIVAAGLQSGQPMFQSVNSLGTWNGSDRTSSEPLQRLGCDPEAGQSGWLSHPLGCHTWRATFEVSVEGLESTDRERYLDLALFPEDQPVPESALSVLWEATRKGSFMLNA